MEPMRNPEFNMGTNGMWSVWNSMVYIILGVAVIGFFYAFAYWRKKKGLPVWIGTNVTPDGKWAKPAKIESKPMDAPKPIEPQKPVEKEKDALSAPKKIVRPGKDESENKE